MASTKGCVFVDFETRSKCPIEHGAARYAADPSTDILLVSYAIEDEPAIGFSIQDEPEKLQPLYKFIRNGGILVAHNMLFEAFIIKYVGKRKYGWPSMNYRQFQDTMHMAGRAGLPLSLDGATSALKVTLKDSVGKTLIKIFSIPQKDGTFIEMNDRPKQKQQFIEYCDDDVNGSRDIYVNMPAFIESELEDIAIDFKANLYGVPINVEASKLIYENVLIEQAGFAEKADSLTKGIITKMTQVQRLKKWVIQYVNPEIPNCAAATIVEILNGEWGEIDEITEQLLLMRQHSGKSSTGKYLRYVHSSINGRVYGMVLSFGTHTGRVISKLLNLANLPKPSVKYETMDELVFDLSSSSIATINNKYGSYLKASATAIRGMIEAPEGKMLCVADYGAIEARIVFWLSGCHAGLKKYHEGFDMYVDMATVVFDKLYDDINNDERWVGKNVILGAGFGLGWRGFKNTCLNYGREIPDDICQTSINGYREAYGEVVDSWNQCDTMAMMACKTGKTTFACNGQLAFKTFKTKSGVMFLLMKLPSGRFMMYPGISIVTTTTPWGARRKAIQYRKVINGKWLYETTYGGKIFQNAVQATARDIMYNGVRNVQNDGYKMLFQVYDEVITEHDEDEIDLDHFCDLLCETPEWAEGLPLIAEGKVLKRYQKI